MKFKKLDIYTKSDAVQVLIMQLSELGITGFEIYDKADFEEFAKGGEYHWDYISDSLCKEMENVKTHITCYVQHNEQGMEMLNAVSGVLAQLRENDGEFYGSLELVVDEVNEEDWANNWKQYYKPFTVGERLLIKPSWEKVEDAFGRKVLEIDPASSFGTGQHHTTRLVLELLDRLIHGGERVLDLGTGSGILATAALLLGAKEVTATDVFLNSVKTAQENAGKNGFGSDRVKVFCGNVADDEELRGKIGGGYDVITANIVADVIISMSPYFAGFLKSDGVLIVSGIITERLEETLAALSENGFEVTERQEKEDWNALTLRQMK